MVQQQQYIASFQEAGAFEIHDRFCSLIQAPFVSTGDALQSVLFQLHPAKEAEKRSGIQLLYTAKKPDCLQPSFQERFQNHIQEAHAISRKYGAHLFFRVMLFQEFPILWHDPFLAARLFATAIVTSVERPSEAVSYILDGSIVAASRSIPFSDGLQCGFFIEFFEHLTTLLFLENPRNPLSIFLSMNSLFDEHGAPYLPDCLNRAILLTRRFGLGIWYDGDRMRFDSQNDCIEKLVSTSLLYAVGEGISYESALQELVSNTYMPTNSWAEVYELCQGLMILLKARRMLRVLEKHQGEVQDDTHFGSITNYFLLYEEVVRKEKAMNSVQGDGEFVRKLLEKMYHVRERLYQLLSLKSLHFRKQYAS